MGEVTVQIDKGELKKLQQNIAKFQEKFSKELAEIIDVWCVEVCDYAKTNFNYLTPWEVRQPTGNLLNSLRVKVEISSGSINAEIIAGGTLENISGEGKGETTGQVTADVPYAVYVEFGTETSRPNPFLKPAVESLLPKLSKYLSQAFKHLSMKK